MSQPKQYADGEGDPLDLPIRSTNDLIQFFLNSQRPRSQFLVGVEHEKFAYDLRDFKPLKYETNPGIGLLLQSMLAKRQSEDQTWVAIKEGDQLIGLTDHRSSVTLEPGGQVELSGAPLRSMMEIDKEIDAYEKMSLEAAQDLQIGFISVGYHPTATRQEIGWMPKGRYKLMRAYMPRVGSRGLDMMLRTCTVQANLDYENEADMVLSVKTALAVSPIVTALFASSPFAEGKPSGFLSERTMVWQDTDPVRCGFPSVAFARDFGFEKWIEYALDVPMYFIRRDNQYVDMTGQSFREFMKNGLNGYVASIRDFADHLTTIFTEVRIKPHIEMRSADVGPPSHLRALAAFWKGILYEPGARQKAYELMEDPSASELANLQIAAAREGLRAVYRDTNILSLAEQLLEIGRDGLIILQDHREKNSEQSFLKPLFQIVEKRKTLAEELLELYQTTWAGDIQKLFPYFSSIA